MPSITPNIIGRNELLPRGCFILILLLRENTEITMKSWGQRRFVTDLQLWEMACQVILERSMYTGIIL